MADDAGLPISTQAFCPQQAIERDGCRRFIRVKFDRLATTCPNAAPAADECSIAEQRRFNRELVEPRHVAGRVDAVQQDVGVRHSATMLWIAIARPTHMLNR